MGNFNFSKINARCLHAAEECKSVSYSRYTTWAAFIYHLTIIVPVKMCVCRGEINFRMDTCRICHLFQVSCWDFCVIHSACVYSLNLIYNLSISHNPAFPAAIQHLCNFLFDTCTVWAKHIWRKSFSKTQLTQCSSVVNIMIFSTGTVQHGYTVVLDLKLAIWWRDKSF